MIDSIGQKVALMIRRLVCPCCGRLHHELPDCIVPYKRHCAETFEKIITGKTDDVPCENRTVKRILAWWMFVLPYFLNIMDSLSATHEIVFNSPPAFREIMRAIANTNNWIFAFQLCTRSDFSTG